MNNVKLLIAGSAFFAMSAQAADRVSIDVKVTLEAAACTPILSNGGVVNFGSHSVNRLSTQHYTQIGTRNINMTITCESATGIAITADEAQRIIAREGEGENLIVNRLAIPHCWSEQERRFRGFFITLAQPVEVNNEVINHVLIACAAADARHELKIFSYLASILCQHPAEIIAGLTGYEAFMELLHKG